MEFRNILISNPAKLSIRNQQLCIRQEEELLIPIEDICTLMLESQQIQISAAALEMLTSAGVTVFFCNREHLPSAQILSMNQHCRKTSMLHAQIEIGRPLQKQLWKSIVVQKIINQAACLRILKRDGAEHLEQLAKSVKSGDSDNTEAVAAAWYFPRLFGKGFTRRSDQIENIALNYGYSILRGSVARNLVVHGLEPCLGLCHDNEGNAFNLADDLIEPYRPLVDLYVASQSLEKLEALTPALKKGLFNLTNKMVLQENQKLRVMTSVDRATFSLASSILAQEHKLQLPELIPLEEGWHE